MIQIHLPTVFKEGATVREPVRVTSPKTKNVDNQLFSTKNTQLHNMIIN